MARNRVIYQSESVLVSQDVNVTGVATGDNDIAPLHRIQSANYSFAISRQDVNCFGELASIDRIITDTPTVSFDCSYYLPNLGNENKLGFHVWADPANVPATPVSCISGIIDSTTNNGLKNYFIVTTKEGSDAVDNTQSGKYESIIGVGNASITSYSTEGAVGGLPTVSVSCEGQNMNMVSVDTSAGHGYTGFYDGYTGYNAANQTLWNGSDNLWYGAGYEVTSGVALQVTGTAPGLGAAQNIYFVQPNPDLSVNTNGTITGLAATLPAGTVLSGKADRADTITLDGIVEKGAQYMVGTTAGSAPVAGEIYEYFPNFPSSPVVTYISGSNPSIDSSDGSVATWEGSSQAGNPLLPLKTANFNTAPVKLPVVPKSLTVGHTGAAGGTFGTNYTTGSITTLRPGDITLTLKKAGTTTDSDLPGIIVSSAPIQSYNISFDLSRTPIEKIGSRYAFARPVDFPITASFGFDALVSDLRSGNIADLIDCDESYDATVILKNSVQCGGTSEAVIAYEVKGLKIDDQSYSSSIGDNKSVSYSFTSQVGGPEQTNVGVFMSGYYKGNDNAWA
jgi:hypothetical protein